MKIHKIFDQLVKKKTIFRKIPLTEEDLKIKEICEQSFYGFVREAWPHLEGNPFVDGWHIRAVCEHLEAMESGHIKRLLINCPPRVGKSSLCAVMFPAWLFVRDPKNSILGVSYSKQLSIRDAVKCRRLMQTGWYTKFWGEKTKLTADVKQKARYDLLGGGYRLTTSIGSTTTGEGAKYLICDDANNISEMGSSNYRNMVINYFDEVLQTRHHGIPSEFRQLVIQQRCHSSDLSSHLLSKKDPRLVHLILPMEYESKNHCSTVWLPSLGDDFNKKWQDPRTKDGAPLWPEQVSDYDLKMLKEKDFNNDPYLIAGQLQQNPSPRGGAIFKDEWFRIWEHPWLPPFEAIIQSYDTAFTGSASSAYSACLTFGIFKDSFGVERTMLLSVWKCKAEYPVLKQMAQRLYKNCFDTDYDDEKSYPAQLPPVDWILIEGKASGYSLVQEMRLLGFPVQSFEPSRYGDKETRARRIADVVENGLVYLVCDENNKNIPNAYGRLLLKETSTFPVGESMDVVDAFSQCMIWLKQNQWLKESTYLT